MRVKTLFVLTALVWTGVAAIAAEGETFHGIPLPPGTEKAGPATWAPPLGPDEDEWDKVDRQAYKTGLSFKELEAFYKREMPKLGWENAGDPRMLALGVLAWADPFQQKPAKVWAAHVAPGDLPDGEDYDLLLTWATKGD